MARIFKDLNIQNQLSIEELGNKTPKPKKNVDVGASFFFFLIVAKIFELKTKL